MKDNQYLAFDFGADSMRGIAGEIKSNKLSIKELHRAPNGMLRLHNRLHWNVYRLYEEILNCIEKISRDPYYQPATIGIDTWGVDYGLLNKEGELLNLPFAYRDKRTDGIMEEVFQRLDKKTIFQLTGIQFLPFNTIYQLYAFKKSGSSLLDKVSGLLFIPDLFNYFLTGEKKSEFSFATTSQLYNPVKEDWDDTLFETLGLNPEWMQSIIQPGKIIGDLSSHLRNKQGLAKTKVITVASHDTGSAVAAVPAQGKDWAYISSGTWSLMGIEATAPIINEKSFQMGFTNEGGVEGTFRILKNIMGLWLLQETRRSWPSSKTYSYDELTQGARDIKPFIALINPDDQGFLSPMDMSKQITDYLIKTNQYVPDNIAGYSRIIMDSLALKYRYTLDQLREVSPTPINRIHVIGGGVKNQHLCQLTANATGLPVIAGPIEATAIGNLMVQACANGVVSSLSEMREIIKSSITLKEYYPESSDQWEEAYERFKKLIS